MEPTKILLFSDIHFGIHSNSDKYLSICVDTMNWIKDLCKQIGIRRVIFMGDYFDSRSSIDIKTFNYATESLYDLAKSVDGIDMILGNHDLYLRDSTEFHSLAAYDGCENVKIHDEPFLSGDMLLLPWYYGVANCEKRISISNNIKYVFSHHDFPKSFFFGGSTTQKRRGVPKSDTCVISRFEDEFGIDNQLLETVIKNRGVFFSGHIHKQSKVNIGSGSYIQIIGSPYETEYGFGNAKCGVFVITRGTAETDDNVDFIENPFSKKHVEIRTSSFDSDLANIDFPKSFVRLNVDTQESFETISNIQHKISSLNPFHVFNTVFDFTSCSFAGKRDTSENPLESLPNKVTSKIDYINAAIDSADFSNFSYSSNGEIKCVDKKKIKEYAQKYYESILGK